MQKVPSPTVGRREALIRIRRVGICGTDYHAFRGNQPYFTYPRVLGHELSGEIVELGEDAGDFRIGEQVSVIPYLNCGQCVACRNGKPNCCTSIQVLGVHVDGGMCEFLAVPTDHLIKTPGLTLEQSAILEPLSIGAHAVARSGLSAGENVLVVGAGPIGLGVMALAKDRKARVIALDIDEERLRFAKRFAEVDEVVNGARPMNEVLDTLAELTDGEFPTVVFDATGNVSSMENAFLYPAHGGKLVFVGLVKGNVVFSDPEFHKRELTILSSRNAKREDFETVMRAIETGVLKSELYVTHQCDFDSLPNRFLDFLNPEARVIKAMVQL